MIHTVKLTVAGDNRPSLPVNEVFGPTIQGEGMEIGRSCVFLRLHHCPVKCPGCDTAYTWDGSEAGTRADLSDVMKKVNGLLDLYAGAGVVVSGGEPLLQYRNEGFRYMLQLLTRRTWVGLETSGFVGKAIDRHSVDEELLTTFLRAFTSVHLSPKVTPCLHGDGWSDTELLSNYPMILRALGSMRYALKFVVRDVDDLLAVERTLRRPEFLNKKSSAVPVYLMPYGTTADEVLGVCRWLAEDPDAAAACHTHGWIITPRLHSILWGKKRGV